MAVLLAGVYLIFFYFRNNWAKVVLFVVWALTLYGIGQIKDKEL
jgi:hypothetical protein